MDTQQIAQDFLDWYVLIHLKDSFEKVRLFTFMVRKLILLKTGLVQPENLDSLMVQEVLTSGYLYGLYFKEKVEEIFEFLKMKI